MFLNEIEAEYQYLNGPKSDKPKSPVKRKYKPYDFLHTTSDVVPLPIHKVEQMRLERRQRMLAEAQKTLTATSAADTSARTREVSEETEMNTSNQQTDEKVTSALQFAAHLGITNDDLRNAVTGECIVDKDESWRSYFGDPEDVLYQNLQRRLIRFVEDEAYLKKEDFVQEDMKKNIVREAAMKKFAALD